MPKRVKILAVAFVVALALASAVDAKLNVTSLSAITGDIGSITSGSITGVTITGATITGGQINIGSGNFTVDTAGILHLGGPTTMGGTLTLGNLEHLGLVGGGNRYVCTDNNGFLFAAASC